MHYYDRNRFRLSVQTYRKLCKSLDIREIKDSLVPVLLDPKWLPLILNALFLIIGNTCISYYYFFEWQMLVCLLLLVFFSLPGLESWTSNSLTLSSNQLSYPPPMYFFLLLINRQHMYFFLVCQEQFEN